MKTGKIILILGLMIVFAASTCVLAGYVGDPCTVDPDCWSLNQRATNPVKYCVGEVITEDWIHYGVCNTTTLRCMDVPGPQAYWVNCTYYGATTACSNGDLYNFSTHCNLGVCWAYDISLKTNSSSNCDLCSHCKDEASRVSKTAVAEYNIGFDKEYTFDNVTGIYVIAPNNTMDITDINAVRYYCGNGGPFNQSSNLLAWVYNASGTKLATGYNNVGIDNLVNRSNVIGGSSDTCGTPISNVFGNVFNEPSGMSSTYTKIDSLYKFVEPSNYTVFVDLISGYCTPTDANHKPVTQNYICPWLGGTARANLCNDSVNNLVDGWLPIENITVLVPGPDINITAPSNESNLNVTKIQKTWNITNKGVGRIIANIAYDCGNWTCAFDGYNGNAIPLEENEAYIGGITLNITVTSPDVNHPVGIIVTYDEGYGLSSIPPITKTSYISMTNANAFPWVIVTSNQPAPGSTVPNSLTLNYTIFGSNNTYNVSLNLNNIPNNQTGVGKLKNTLYNFTVANLSAGLYWWNVTAYINSSVYGTSETRNFTVTSALGPGIYYIT
jgi:hypothetical protein